MRGGYVEQRVRDNWEKVRVALEASGKTDCYLYRRALAISRGTTDPGPFPSAPPNTPTT